MFSAIDAFTLLAQAEDAWVKLQAIYAAIKQDKFATPAERAKALQDAVDLANLFKTLTVQAKAAFASISGSVTPGDVEAALARDSQVPTGWNPPPAQEPTP